MAAAACRRPRRRRRRPWRPRGPAARRPRRPRPTRPGRRLEVVRAGAVALLDGVDRLPARARERLADRFRVRGASPREGGDLVGALRAGEQPVELGPVALVLGVQAVDRLGQLVLRGEIAVVDVEVLDDLRADRLGPRAHAAGEVGRMEVDAVELAHVAAQRAELGAGEGRDDDQRQRERAEAEAQAGREREVLESLHGNGDLPDRGSGTVLVVVALTAAVERAGRVYDVPGPRLKPRRRRPIASRTPARAWAWASACPSRPGFGFGLGGGIVSTGGGASGQTSSTRHGAWSTTNRAGGARLCGPSRSWSPSRASTSRSASCGGGDDLALDAAASRRAARRRGRAGRARPRAGSPPPRRRSRGWARVGGAGRPSSPLRAPPAISSASAPATWSSMTSASAGSEGGGLVDRGLPGVLDDPDERAHDQSSTNPPNHRRTVAAMMPAGTVSSPSGRTRAARRSRPRGAGRGARAAWRASRRR